MKRNLTIALLMLVAAICAAQPASVPVTDDTLAQIKFDQKINGQISPDLPFRDETGKTVRIGDYLGRRPAILVLGYYECPMLCSLTLNGLIEALEDVKMDAGKQFDVINVSIDPRETPALAAAKKRTYMKRYGHRGAEQGWHFLTGDAAADRKLADEAGFRYVYDPRSKEFAHPSGIVILTPDGKIAHYLFGVTFSPKELDATLRDAGARKTGSPIQQFILLCFHYSPLTGKYGNLIMTIVRISGVAMLAALGLLFFRLKPAQKRQIEEAKP